MSNLFSSNNMDSKSFSLILGGGAARGFAHIWVIKHIEELGIVPWLIVGTSMGALIGAFYACGYTSHQISQIASKVSLIKLLDFDIKKGWIKWDKIIHFLEKHIADREFSQLQIPLKIIATNIDTGEKVVFSEWRVIDAIRASISIPWIFTPVISNGAHLVDGGIVANLPIEEAITGFPIVAMSVQKWEMFRDNDKISDLFGKWFFTYGYHILLKAIQLMMIKNEEFSHKTHPDALFLSLMCDDIEYYDFHRMSDLIDEWYNASSSIKSYIDSFRKDALFLGNSETNNIIKS